MIKQILHIFLFTALTLLLLNSIAKSQDITYMDPPSSEVESAEVSGEVHEEVMEYVYKYDLLIDEKTIELSFDNLPEKVKSNFIVSKYGNWEIMKVFEVEMGTEKTFMLLVEKKGYVETLQFDRQGKFISES